MSGLPYENRYDCETKKPAFGILIPGLQPGVSIVTPWGSASLILDGDRVKFDMTLAREIPGAKHGLKGGLSLGWDSKTGAKFDLLASRPIGGALGTSGELRGGLRYDREVGAFNFQASGKVSGKFGLPGQGTIDAAKEAGLPASGGLSVGLRTTGVSTATVKAYGAKSKVKFKVNPQ